MKKILFLIASLSILLFGICGIAKAESAELYPAVEVQPDGEKWGYVNGSGIYEIKPQYDFAKEFNKKGIAIVADGKSSYGICKVWFIDKSGKTVAGPFQSNIPEFTNGVAVIKEEGKGSKVLDENANVILESSYSLYEYQEGLIRFSQSDKDGEEVFGFMDIKGKVVIPAVYRRAEAFSGGTAAVAINDGSYGIIDKNGKILEICEAYPYNYGSSEGYRSYFDDKSKKYGYKTDDGEVAIAPQYSEAYAFRDGHAVIKLEKDGYEYSYGLINNKGEYVLKPEYSGITYLGHDLYAVSNNFYSFYDTYAPKAIFNGRGAKLTEYKFYSVYPFENGYASVCDDTNTFFINEKGIIAKELPRLKGIGQMKIYGEVVRADIDGKLSYLKKNGSTLWEEDETVYIDDGIKVRNIKYRLDYCTFIEYPEIQGMKDKKLQDTVNKRLKSYFTGGYKSSKSAKDGYTEDISAGFNAVKIKNLLIIEHFSYDYLIGAAHGQSSRKYYPIDLKTGAFYELKDLFKAGSKYTEKLSSLIKRQVELNTRISSIYDNNITYFTDSPKVAANQPFVVSEDSIRIYYRPYDIAPYAAGFPEFEIPFGQIFDMIDTKGAFWNSFNDKKVIPSKIHLLSEMDNTAVSSISSLIKGYETNVINAVNGNDFSKVEGCLLKGSSLYSSQKELVRSLYAQNIKEKLDQYELYAIAFDESKREYKIFVIEKVVIKYPGKDYTDEQSYRCYTARADSGTKALKLTDMQEW